MDVIPYSAKQVSKSKEDKFALSLLEEKTVRVPVKSGEDTSLHYATPLLRKPDASSLCVPLEVMMPNLRRTEKHHASKPELTEVHNDAIRKLVNEEFVKVVDKDEADESQESWYIPHHVVTNNNKSRLVFNCSFEYKGLNLNKQLLPGPSIGSSLLGVLLRFRRNKIAISGDIKAMFHQVRLLPEDQSTLRFIWRDMNDNKEPTIYQWQVLPFGTTCSPCCATFALMKHARDAEQQHPEVMRCVDEAFYVDNCLDSLKDPCEAKSLVMNLRKVLAEGGFNIRQWASNKPEVLSDLPPEAKSTSFKLWSTLDQGDVNEAALGLHWKCDSDTLAYRHRTVNYETLNMRAVYQVLATQYDPIGYLTPYTSRAKVIIQDMWKGKSAWEEEITSQSLRKQFTEWESELDEISNVCINRCYIPTSFEANNIQQQLHVFCDASERIYGSVAYLRSENTENDVHVSFVSARSRVAPKKQLSMPRLELCAALTGAQLADTLNRELGLSIAITFLWSDSTTVLTWLKSDSCRYKVFVGTRVAEIQSLTPFENWHYVNTKQNPADDLTRGKSLKELCDESRWRNGPPFLREIPEQWQSAEANSHDTDLSETESELRKTTVVFNTNVSSLPDPAKYDTFDGLVNAYIESVDGAAEKPISDVEMMLFQRVQEECFADEARALKATRPVLTTSRLIGLAPEYDPTTKLIRVGGRLREAEDIPKNVKHPVLLDPTHNITKLLIKRYDDMLKHYGPERLLAEIRREFWILRGREAIKRHQRECLECQRLRAMPKLPKMADLPKARLRLYKPAFYSTGVDCFGPMWVKVGRRQEKRWGIVFKCMTTRAVYLDLLENMDADAFLMSVRRFISHRGKPHEILSDCGTNFKGGNTELMEAFEAMNPNIRDQLMPHKIIFKYNPPYAPHFGGVWEREVRSVKQGLKAVLGTQAVTEPVLRTVMSEICAILNSKPLGYISSDVADIDPVTPNSLLMGRPDTSLPQVVYPEDELLGRRRWRHCQVLADQFWKAFIRRYLPTLQPRGKWHRDHNRISVDDVVMIMDPQQIRANWLVGRVTEAPQSSDGKVRAARVCVGEHTYLRPVSRLVKLPNMNETD